METMDKIKGDMYLRDKVKEASLKLSLGNCKELVETWFFAKTRDIFKDQKDLADAFLWDAHNKLIFTFRVTKW